MSAVTADLPGARVTAATSHTHKRSRTPSTPAPVHECSPDATAPARLPMARAARAVGSRGVGLRAARVRCAPGRANAGAPHVPGGETHWPTIAGSLAAEPV